MITSKSCPKLPNTLSSLAHSNRHLESAERQHHQASTRQARHPETRSRIRTRLLRTRRAPIRRLRRRPPRRRGRGRGRRPLDDGVLLGLGEARAVAERRVLVGREALAEVLQDGLVVGRGREPGRRQGAPELAVALELGYVAGVGAAGRQRLPLGEVRERLVKLRGVADVADGGVEGAGAVLELVAGELAGVQE
ncbi:hypothetical protein PG987_010096 [Apiospora arundinis]